MDDLSDWAAALPESESALLKAMQGERRKLEARAAAAIKRIESDRDEGLARFERALGVIAGEDASQRRKSPEPPKRRRSRRKVRETTAEEAEKRRQAVRRFMDEQGRPLTCAEIVRGLRLREFSTKSALRRLIKEGVVVRTGSGAGTRYQLAVQQPRREERGTTQGLIVTTIRDRGTASPRELAQVTGASEETVERECGTLILEGIIRMTQRDGFAVYAMQAAA